MSHLLRQGRLEVETDLLLGAEDVLLPSRGWSAAPRVEGERDASSHAVPQPATSRTQDPPARAGHRGFEADLFAPSSSKASSAQIVPPRAALAPAASNAPSGAAAPARSQVAHTIVEPHPQAVAGSQIAPIADRIAPPEGADRRERLAALEAIHASECPHCTTAQGHTRLVFGEGNPEAELFFVGEAPGEVEDREGRPFVGPSGDKLNEMIAAMGLRREDVYIANVLKSRPPNNRTPLAHEVDRCGPYLLAQLAIVRPKVVVTLGGPATKLLLATELGITRLRGVAAKVTLGTAGGAPFEVPVMPTFHPAYLLRNYTVETRQQVWSDLKQVLGLLGREAPAKRGS